MSNAIINRLSTRLEFLKKWWDSKPLRRGSRSFKRWLESNKDSTATLASLATIVALIAGGTWFLIFLIPSYGIWSTILVEPKIEARALSSSQELLLGTFHLKNLSKITMHLSCFQVTVRQVVPSSPNLIKHLLAIQAKQASVFDWPTLATKTRDLTTKNFIVEPGNEEYTTQEIVIPATARDPVSGRDVPIRTVMIYSAFQKNTANRCQIEEDGALAGPVWESKVLFDLQGAEAGL